jgi:hypothetical protein
MTNCCDVSNPLIRDGVSQSKRQVQALPPDFVKVDEKDIADFLVFAYQLSKQIIYYKANTHPTDNQPDPTDNQPDGNWQGFFDSYAPVQIALISKTSSQNFRNTYNRHLDRFLFDRTPKNLAPLLLTLKNKFSQIFDWHGHIKTYPPLASYIKGLFKSNLRNPLLRLWAFGRAYSIETGDSLFGANLEAFCKDLNDAFQLNIDFNLPPAPDQTPLKGTTFEARTEIDAVFQVLFQNYRQIIQKTQNSNYLTDSLKAQQDYPPHLVLYLAFWEVMKPVRDDLNCMTQRHLDFFYRDVLLLPEKAVKPDLAHLIFELAKFQQEYKLDSGTAFKGGKDANGVELVYKLNEEILVHQAQIANLKGLFLASQETGAGKSPKLTGLYSSPIANSVDGQGQEFPKEQIVKVWQPFGNADRPHALIGVAIASDIFYLQESDRTITFTLNFDKNLEGAEANNFPNIFTVDFSGKKDWIVGEILPPQSSATSLNGKTLTLEVRLTAEQDPVEDYHKGLRGALLSTNKPVARLHIKDQAQVNNLSPYSYFRDLKLEKLTVSTKVKNVRNLILQNDLSVLDPTKPFQPFGSFPKVGTSFYIGSKEVFQKRLTALTLQVQLEKSVPTDWRNYYAAYGVESTFNTGQILVQALRNKQWQSTSIASQSLFNLSELKDQNKDLSNDLSNLRNGIIKVKMALFDCN